MSAGSFPPWPPVGSLVLSMHALAVAAYDEIVGAAAGLFKSNGMCLGVPIRETLTDRLGEMTEVALEPCHEVAGSLEQHWELTTYGHL